MKKILLIAAAVITLASCSKEKSATPDNVFGKWELVSIQGSFPTPQAVAPGNGNIYQLNSDSTYVRYIDNKVMASGKFRIHINERRDGREFGSIYLTHSNLTDAWSYLPGKIFIGTNAADGPVYEFNRIK